MIEILNIQPLNSIEPAFRIIVKKDYELKKGSIIHVSGLLLSEDNKILSQVIDARESTVTSSYPINIGDIIAQGTSTDEELNRKREQEISLIAFLTRETVNYLETIRERNPKKDVILTLRLKVRRLVPNALVTPLYEKQPLEYTLNQKRAETIIVYEQNPQYSSNRKNLWVISGDTSPKFLKVEDDIEEIKLKPIASSDWIHDYCPSFNIGKYMIIEVPLVETIVGTGELIERITDATKSLDKMREGLMACEWNRVIEDSRGVFELFRKYGATWVKDILIRDGYTDMAATDLVKAIDNVFDYSSKFHHRTDVGGKTIMPEVKASKEDAYLIYTTAMSLVNLLARKTRRIEK